jgi:hypothetical protein
MGEHVGARPRACCTPDPHSFKGQLKALDQITRCRARRVRCSSSISSYVMIFTPGCSAFLLSQRLASSWRGVRPKRTASSRTSSRPCIQSVIQNLFHNSKALRVNSGVVLHVKSRFTELSDRFPHKLYLVSYLRVRIVDPRWTVGQNPAELRSAARAGTRAPTLSYDYFFFRGVVGFHVFIQNLDELGYDVITL